MLEWFAENHQWLFDGLGIAVVTLVIKVLLRRNRPEEKRKRLERRLAHEQRRAWLAKEEVLRLQGVLARSLSSTREGAESPGLSAGALSCSFCGKSQKEVRKLIAGPKVYICDECAGVCDDIIFEESRREGGKSLGQLCSLTIEAANPCIAHGRRESLRKDIQALAMGLRHSRRLKGGDSVAGSSLDRIVGTGAFGTVWLARQVEEHAEVAVKVFDEDKLAIGLMLWRFLRGIRAMKHLSDRNDVPRSVIRLIQVDESGLAFSMPYLPCGDLERIKDFGWAIEKKLVVFSGVLEAVSYAHRNGIVHRDIKPANVVLDRHLNPVLTDFDIADLQFSKTQTITAGGLGTPQFAAPEQLAGASLSASSTADIYSLGKLLYFLVAEKAPPMGSTDEGHMPSYLTTLVPSDLGPVIHRCISTNPTQRYQSIDELRDAYRFPAPPSEATDQGSVIQQVV